MRTLYGRIHPEEKRYAGKNSSLRKAADHSQYDTLFDITRGIDSGTLLEKHGIESTEQLDDFVAQLPAERHPSLAENRHTAVRIITAGACLLLSLAVSAGIDAEAIESAFPLLVTVCGSVLLSALAFAAVWAVFRVSPKRRYSRTGSFAAKIAALFTAVLSAWGLWHLQISSGGMSAKNFETLCCVCRLSVFACLAAVLIRISFIPAAERTIFRFVCERAPGRYLERLISTIRMYPYRDELYARRNYAKIVQVIERRNTKPAALPKRAVRIQPEAFIPAENMAAQKKYRSAPVQRKDTSKQETGYLRNLYRTVEKKRTALDDTQGSLRSSIVVRTASKSSRSHYSLIEHNEQPLVFVLEKGYGKNRFCEELISSFALFSPMELIEQNVHDPLHGGLHFTGYENTVSIVNDSSRLWNNIRSSMSEAAQRRFEPDDSTDAINRKLYALHEESSGYLRWQIVHFLEPALSLRLSDLKTAEEGKQYGFIPVLYFKESEWEESSELRDCLSRMTAGLYHISSNGKITQFKGEEE